MNLLHVPNPLITSSCCCQPSPSLPQLLPIPNTPSSKTGRDRAHREGRGQQVLTGKMFTDRREAELSPLGPGERDTKRKQHRKEEQTGGA